MKSVIVLDFDASDNHIQNVQQYSMILIKLFENASIVDTQSHVIIIIDYIALILRTGGEKVKCHKRSSVRCIYIKLIYYY